LSGFVEGLMFPFQNLGFWIKWALSGIPYLPGSILSIMMSWEMGFTVGIFLLAILFAVGLTFLVFFLSLWLSGLSGVGE
jgi:ABC-type Na+ efflux pump permease subunit